MDDILPENLMLFIWWQTVIFLTYRRYIKLQLSKWNYKFIKCDTIMLTIVCLVIETNLISFCFITNRNCQKDHIPFTLEKKRKLIFLNLYFQYFFKYISKIIKYDSQNRYILQIYIFVNVGSNLLFKHVALKERWNASSFFQCNVFEYAWKIDMFRLGINLNQDETYH